MDVKQRLLDEAPDAGKHIDRERMRLPQTSFAALYTRDRLLPRGANRTPRRAWGTFRIGSANVRLIPARLNRPEGFSTASGR
jgi:hypothetical protein